MSLIGCYLRAKICSLVKTNRSQRTDGTKENRKNPLLEIFHILVDVLRGKFPV